MDFEKPTDITVILQNLITLYFNKDYESVCKMLGITYNSDYKQFKNEASKKYYNNGMEFVNEDNPSIFVRLYVDNETKIILDTLSMVTNKSIDEKSLNDLMIERWIDKVHVEGILKKEDIIKNVGKETEIKLEVGKNTWKCLSKACRNKNIYMKEGFKMSVIKYLMK
jgi:hypothetical protein